MSGRVHLLKGADAVLLAEAVHDLIDRVVGDADRGEVLQEFRGDDYDLQAVVLAVSTASMFGDRVVVARSLGRFAVSDLTPLLEYLADPVPDASLILVWDRPTAPGARSHPVPRKLVGAVQAAGGAVEDHGLPGGGKGRDHWIDDQLDAASVRLSPEGRRAVVARLGDDLNRLGGILKVLESTFGAGAGPLGPDDVEPFLGESGGVPPWDLTDAIDRGNVAQSVTLVRRMMHGGGRHPLAVMAPLQTHYERMLRLDGTGIRNEREAAQRLGMKGSPYPARKAMDGAASLGSAKLARATRLLAGADVDLRGRRDGGEQILEVLVARLAALGGGRGPRR